MKKKKNSTAKRVQNGGSDVKSGNNPARVVKDSWLTPDGDRQTSSARIPKG